MAPLERGPNPLTAGRSSSTKNSCGTEVPQEITCKQNTSSLIDNGNDDERKLPPKAPSSCVDSSSNAIQLLTLVQLNSEISSWSDKYEESESNVRIQKLRRNKRRAEKGICEMRSQMDTLQEENEGLRQENEALRLREVDYATMMRKASELLDEMQENPGDAIKTSMSGSVAAEKSLLLHEFETLQKTTRREEHKKSTVDFLEEERQREITEMSSAIETMALFIEELKEEKSRLLTKAQVQEEKIATLEEQEELKVSKIEILESMVRKMVQSLLKQEQQEEDYGSSTILANFELPWSNKPEEKDCLAYILSSQQKKDSLKRDRHVDDGKASPDPPGNDVNEHLLKPPKVADQKLSNDDRPHQERSGRERMFSNCGQTESSDPLSKQRAVRESCDNSQTENCPLSTTAKCDIEPSCMANPGIEKDEASTYKNPPISKLESDNIDATGVSIPLETTREKETSNEKKNDLSTLRDDQQLSFCGSYTVDQPKPAESIEKSPDDESAMLCHEDGCQRSANTALLIVNDTPHSPLAIQKSSSIDDTTENMSIREFKPQQSDLGSGACVVDLSAAMQTIDIELTSAKKELRGRRTKATTRFEHHLADLRRRSRSADSTDTNDDDIQPEICSSASSKSISERFPSSLKKATSAKLLPHSEYAQKVVNISVHDNRDAPETKRLQASALTYRERRSMIPKFRSDKDLKVVVAPKATNQVPVTMKQRNPPKSTTPERSKTKIQTGSLRARRFNNRRFCRR